MGVYHFLVIVFPIALWNVAFLFILIRALSDGRLAKTLEKGITPLLFLGVLAGAVAYGLGLSAWPYSALTASPLGRNHMLMATWTISYWAVLWVLAWRLGEQLWIGARRWIMLGLSALGVGFLTITGTLGGSLAGNPSGVSDLIRLFGWEVYTTFYVPDAVLWLVVAGSLVLLVLGMWGRGRNAKPANQ
jgi:Predicted membrane protein (DUF2231)